MYSAFVVFNVCQEQDHRAIKENIPVDYILLAHLSQRFIGELKGGHACSCVIVIHNIKTSPLKPLGQSKPIEPVREKTNNLGSDEVRHKPGCTSAEDG